MTLLKPSRRKEENFCRQSFNLFTCLVFKLREGAQWQHGQQRKDSEITTVFSWALISCCAMQISKRVNIGSVSVKCCHVHCTSPPAPAKYDTLDCEACNIQIISYCKLMMTQMSCQMSYFNIFHSILWRWCQSAVSLAAAASLTLRNKSRHVTTLSTMQNFQTRISAILLFN